MTDYFIRRVLSRETRAAIGPAVFGDFEIFYLSCGHTEYQKSRPYEHGGDRMAGRHKSYEYRRCVYCKLGFPVPFGAVSEPQVQCDAEVKNDACSATLSEDADDGGGDDED